MGMVSIVKIQRFESRVASRAGLRAAAGCYYSGLAVVISAVDVQVMSPR